MRLKSKSPPFSYAVSYLMRFLLLGLGASSLVGPSFMMVQWSSIYVFSQSSSGTRVLLLPIWNQGLVTLGLNPAAWVG